MPFFQDLLDTISGEGRRDLAEKELAAKLQISQEQLRLMALKNSPEAIRARAQRNMWIGIGVVVLIIGIIFLIYKRRVSVPKI